MKNKILFIIFNFNSNFFVNKLFSQEIDIQAADIEFSKDQNLTIANNATG